MSRGAVALCWAPCLCHSFDTCTVGLQQQSHAQAGREPLVGGSTSPLLKRGLLGVESFGEGSTQHM